MTAVGKGIAAWLAASVALLLGGIGFVIATANPIGVALLAAGALSLVGALDPLRGRLLTLPTAEKPFQVTAP